MRSADYLRSDIPQKYEDHKDRISTNWRSRYSPAFAPEAKLTKYNDQACLTSLLAAYDLISTIRDVKMVTNYQWITLYSNTLSFVPRIQEYVAAHIHTAKHTTANAKEIVITTAELDRPRDSIRRKKSKFSHRIKFRHIQPKEFQFFGVKSFVETYLSHINASESLIECLRKGPTRYTTFESHFFIDINDKKLATVLELSAPGCVDKLLQIIVDK